MSAKFSKSLTFLAIVSLLVANAAIGFAEEAGQVDGRVNIETVKIESTDQNTGSSPVSGQDTKLENQENPKTILGDNSLADNSQKTDQFLSKVKDELNFTKTDYKQLLNSISDVKKRLELVTEEKTTLKDQLRNLDDQVAVTTEKLFKVISQVLEKENEITLLYEQIEANEVAMEYQKNQLKDYIRTIYQEENAMFSRGDDGSINAFKLLLMDGSVGENLRELDYIGVLNEAGQQMVERLKELEKELKSQKVELEKKKEKLEKLQNELIKEKLQLELQKKAKGQLLKITLGEEEIFTQLLEQTIAQQEQMVEDIRNLSNALAFLERKVADEGPDFDIEKYKSILDLKTQALYNFQISMLGLNPGEFMWPVDPDRGISAYFHDPRYVGTFGVQHNAVDIPEYQGSPVRAASDGIVYVARDNGYGYSYIIIAHAGGFTSVYGHVSNILVQSGQSVIKSSIIALSGGMPGTPGAGYMTTGPHLHFEMLYNGKHVDPLNYLPLRILTDEQIKKLPEKYQEAWSKEILGEFEDREAVGRF